MKNKNLYLVLITAVLAAIILYFALKKNEHAPAPPFLGDTTINIPLTHDSLPQDKNVLLIQLAKKIAGYLHDSNYTELSTNFHPVLGVRFSPYSFIDTSSNVKFSAQQFLKAMQSQQKFLWGQADGSGDSLYFDTKKYFHRYVYDVDFVKAPQIELNHILGFSTSLNNLENIYPDGDFVEFHFPGFDKKYGGMDWRSLRLVFQLYKGQYYLVGIIHDEWTT